MIRRHQRRDITNKLQGETLVRKGLMRSHEGVERLRLVPVIHGNPPYGLFEHSPETGLIPPHRTDAGALLMAEVLGAKSCILVKNVDGLFTEDPQVNPDAELSKEVTVGELIERDMEDMVMERKILFLLRNAVNVKEIKIINGHTRGTLERALNSLH